MNDLEIIKMSEKGQLVVPQSIRESQNMNPGERFMAFGVGDGVLFKKVEIPEMKIEFEKLAKEVEAQFRKERIKKKDTKEAIKWARR